MSKADLISQLEAREIKFDKRWGEDKLKEALESGIKESLDNVEKDLDKLNDEQYEEAKLQDEKENTVKEEPNETVKQLRSIAYETSVKYAMRDNNVYNNRVMKGQNKILDKVIKQNGDIEIYEKESGKYIRTYSKKAQGKNYKELAQMFIDKRRPRTIR